MLVLVLGLPGRVGGTTVRPRSFEETAAAAESIVVGRVVEVRSHAQGKALSRLQTDYVVEVMDVVGSASGIAKGTTVTLSFWGGTLGRQTQGIVGAPTMEQGNSYVLMLAPGWAKSVRFSPLVGFHQGFFPVVTYDGRRDVVVDHFGRPLYALGGGKIVGPEKALRAKTLAEPLTLPDFVRELRVALPRLRGNRSTVAQDRAETPRAVVPGVRVRPFGSPLRLAPGRATGYHEPRGSHGKDLMDLPAVRARLGRAESRVAAPPLAAPTTAAPRAGATPPSEASPAPDRDQSKFAAFGRCRTPIVVNPLPDAQTPWSPVDQECMGLWNFSVKGLFAVLDQPHTPGQWGDGVFDIHGFLDDAQLQERFGALWAPDIVAATFYALEGGQIIEADIALNAAVNWTLANEEVLDGGSANSFRWVMSRELGHMAGLADSAVDLAVMSAPPAPYRAFSIPFTDDAEGVRRLYPSLVVPRRDLAIYLFQSAGGRDWKDAMFPAECRAGSPIRVSQFTLSNAGTEPVDQPRVVLGFKADRRLEGDLHPAAEVTFRGTLQPFQFFSPDSVLVEFEVPRDIPPGDYYLFAALPDEKEGASIPAFPYSNNIAFSRTKVRVTR
jgi:hypothetical protein